tara:strand:- start:397 stop:1449 length:1053 start_codon:yes stop_codon:yes gene_type:complete
MGEGGLDGQGDFVLYHAVVDNVFRYGYKDFSHLDYWTLQSQENYVEGSIMTPYLGSHDTSRLISRLDNGGNNPDNKWVEQSLPQQPTSYQPYIESKIAFSWLLTIPGAPVLYMGDEYGEYGGSDPDNRHSFRSGNQLNSNEMQLVSFVQELGNIRQQSNDLQEGTYRSIFSDETLLIFARETANSETVVLINSGETSREISLTYESDIFYRNYLEVRSNLSFSVVEESLTFTVNSNDFSIYVKNNLTENNGSINDTNENIVDSPTDETEIVEDNDPDTVANESEDSEEIIEEQDNNSDRIDNEASNQEDKVDEYSNNVNNSQDEDFLLVRSILFITFLSLLITFIYTRRG